MLKQQNRHIRIGTKWGYRYVANFNPNAEQHEVKEHSLEMLNEQWAKSKSLLSNLSVYQIHSATLETGVLRNYNVLARLHELKVEHGFDLGVTVTGVNQREIVKQALGVEVNGEPLFGAIQATYNVLDQSLIDVKSELNDRSVIIKEAMANGRLLRNGQYPHYQEMYAELERIALENNVDVDAVALRFVMDNFEKAIVLSGASSLNQLKSNLQANNLKLKESDLESLKSFGVSPTFYWSERSKLTWN